MAASCHIPVMADEVIEWLRPEVGQTLVDGTLGGGGHTRRLAQAVGSSGLVVALDRDEEAVCRAVEELAMLPVKPFHANYSNTPEALAECDLETVHGIVLDLGLSSDQLANRDLGFSFHSDGPLDLRFDTSLGEPAWKLLERLRAEPLAAIIYQFGEERLSRRIARKIVEQQSTKPIRTAADLAQLLARCVPRSKGHRIDPATRTFQALRIAVNDELKWLEVALKRLPDCLKPGGRIAIISFHSLEDRIVKNAFREDPRLEVITKKPLRPTESEVTANPRSRSAKFRVAERLA